MAKVLDYQDYTQLLRDDYLTRCSKIKDYNLSLYADFLGISVSLISRVLSGKRGISESNANSIAEKITKTKQEQEHFQDLVIVKHSRSIIKKEKARIRIIQRMQKHNSKLGRSDLSLLNSWLDHSLRQAAFFMNIPVFKAPQEVADYFGVSLSEIRASLSKLVQLDLLVDQGGVYRPKDLFVTSKEQYAGEEAKELHFQFIEKSKLALSEHPTHNRDYSVTLLNSNPDHLKKLKEEIKTFRKNIGSKASLKDKDSSGVYCLQVHLFELKK